MQKESKGVEIEVLRYFIAVLFLTDVKPSFEVGL